jgi:hypothetical protein
MRFEKFSFGAIRIDGTTYEHDVVIDRGQVRKTTRFLRNRGAQLGRGVIPAERHVVGAC